MKQEPEEIPDTEHELVLERVCAIDVAKDSGKVCVRVSGRAGKRVSKVWDVPARTGAVAELAEHLLAEGIEKVTVESTSDYWRIWFYVLEAAGLSVQLVNARDVKNVPGRPKTDKLDATRGGAGAGADGARESTTIERLDEIPGISPGLAQIILAEIGLDMSRFPTAAHLVSWAKLCPPTIQSGAIQRSGKTGRGRIERPGVLESAMPTASCVSLCESCGLMMNPASKVGARAGNT